MAVLNDTSIQLNFFVIVKVVVLKLGASGKALHTNSSTTNSNDRKSRNMCKIKLFEKNFRNPSKRTLYCLNVTHYHHIYKSLAISTFSI